MVFPCSRLWFGAAVHHIQQTGHETERVHNRQLNCDCLDRTLAYSAASAFVVYVSIARACVVVGSFRCTHFSNQCMFWWRKGSARVIPVCWAWQK